MAYNFYPVNRDQSFLFPPSLRDWVPEDDLSWFILDAVKDMDISGFYRRYREDGTGGKGYDPAMMAALLLYAYCLGERSSRRIEWLCQRDVGFKVVSANQVPDHCSVARFRKTNQTALGSIFKEVLRLCSEAGLVKVGLIAVDGTKMKANASLSASHKADTIERQIEKILKEAAEVDEREDRMYGDKRGDELPPELRKRKDRLERLKECRERIRKQDEAKAAQWAAKKEARKAKEETQAKQGKKVRGRKPKDKKPKPSKANVTDPDSKIMKTRKGYIQGYNAQLAVTKDQIIVAAEVTEDCNDVNQLKPMLDKACENIAELNTGEDINNVAADAGYWNQAAIEEIQRSGPELFVATTKDWKQRKAMREKPTPRGRIPKTLSVRDRMERKLLTKRGRALYANRGKTVEPVIGQTKSARGCDGFMRRGKEACAGEWKFLAATGNLLKLWRSGKRKVKKVMETAMSLPSLSPEMLA